jgi:hypothetical protein
VAGAAAAGEPSFALGAFLTAFHVVKAEGDNPGTVLLFWTSAAGAWRVVSYAVDVD